MDNWTDEWREIPREEIDQFRELFPELAERADERFRNWADKFLKEQAELKERAKNRPIEDEPPVDKYKYGATKREQLAAFRAQFRALDDEYAAMMDELEASTILNELYGCSVNLASFIEAIMDMGDKGKELNYIEHIHLLPSGADMEYMNYLFGCMSDPNTLWGYE